MSNHLRPQPKVEVFLRTNLVTTLGNYLVERLATLVKR